MVEQRLPDTLAAELGRLGARRAAAARLVPVEATEQLIAAARRQAGTLELAPAVAVVAGQPVILNETHGALTDPFQHKRLVELTAHQSQAGSALVALNMDQGGLAATVQSNRDDGRATEVFFWDGAPAMPQGAPLQACQGRVFIPVTAGEQGAVAIHSHGEPGAWGNHVVACHLQRGSRLDLGVFCHGGQQTTLAILAELEEGAVLNMWSMGRLVGLHRTHAVVVLGGAGAQYAWRGAVGVMAHDDSACRLKVYHVAPHTKSMLRTRALAAEQGRLAFEGHVAIAQTAGGSEALVKSDGLLLNQGAWLESRPEFFIETDDVQCAHGATVGRLDQEALFYLRSRGLGARMARRLLLHAQLQDVQEGVVKALEVMAQRMTDQLVEAILSS
jgi:Fe-S cluster assembly scaffold protein SufB